MKKTDFENGKILQNILQTALPMLVAQFLSLLYNIVDRIYIGRIPDTGTMALGAVGLVFPVIVLITGFSNMYGLGGAPLLSMEYGRGNREKAGAIMNTAFRLILLTALILTVLTEVFASPLLTLFGATKEASVYAVPYLRWYALGTVFAMVTTGMNPYINAQGYAVIGMITVTLGAATNIILDPIFIFTLGMGVTGAAIATVIAQILSAIVVLRFVFSKKNLFPITKESLISIEGKNPSPLPCAGEIIALGTAPFIMQCTNSLVSVVCNNMLVRYGGELYVSVMTVISSVRQILDTPIGALTEGSSPTISYNYGAKRPDRVTEAIRIMAFLSIGYTLIMWLFIELFPGVLISLFTSDAELAAAVRRPLHLYFFAFVFQSFQYSGQTVFKSLGKKNHAIFFSLFRKVVMVVPLTFLLPHFLGISGVFIAEPVSNVIGGLACFFTMLITVRPELKSMKSIQ